MFLISLGLYLGSHWILVIAAVATVVGLGALAWFLKNWRLALAAIIVAIAGFMYQGAVMHGIQLQLAKDAARNIEILQGREDALKQLVIKDAAQAVADSAKISELERTASETPKNEGACLPADAAGRIGRVR